MRTIRTNTGFIIRGRDARALVRGIRGTALDPKPSLHAYMDDVAMRVEEQLGKEVRTATPFWFLADLIAAGVTWEIDEHLRVNERGIKNGQ